MLKLYSYQEAIQDKYEKNTVDQYVSCMNRLKEEGITENSTSEEIRDALYEISSKPRTRKTYIAAITEYEKSVMGVKDGLLKGNIRRECINDAKDDKTGIEPRRSLKAYRTLITNCPTPKVKTALMLQLESGLRIGEVASIRREDITMHHNRIWIHVRPGKSKKERDVAVRKNLELYRLMEERLKDSDELPFRGAEGSSYDYLKDYGGTTHDLRRHNSRAMYISLRQSGKKKYAALNEVAEHLGHNNLENTRRYLGVVWTNDKGGRWRNNYT